MFICKYIFIYSKGADQFKFFGGHAMYWKEKKAQTHNLKHKYIFYYLFITYFNVCSYFVIFYIFILYNYFKNQRI